MLKVEGNNLIRQLRRKWIALKLVQVMLMCLAFTFLIGSIGIYVWNFSGWLIIPLSLLISISFLLIKPIWKISLDDIARGLNNHFPELEESASIFLQPNQNVSPLQALQMMRIADVLAGVDLVGRYAKNLWIAFAVCMVGISCLLLSFYLPKMHLSNQPARTKLDKTIAEIIPATIDEYSVTITAPAYTGLSVKTQEQFTITAAVGSNVKWLIQTSETVKSLNIIFNAKEIVKLNPIDDDHQQWSYAKILHQSGFYQLEIDGRKSDFYQITAVPDLPVEIKVNQPKQHTTIDIGQPQKIDLNTLLTDDYGIGNGFLSATMASGKGEGVSFTERKIALNTTFRNQKNIQIKQVLDLKALGMKPGDELYFFISATDNHGQSSRSDIYFASIVDTTELMSMSGMTSGVNLVPEYFRSQRQIIIDTEKLLATQNEISSSVFKSRSNELGVDQKLLRLRYGQFLGEENETEIGGDHEDEKHDEHKEEVKFGDVQAIVDKYSHKHDVAEDPTFFEPSVKAKLKAVLTEMWNSELKLRTYQPQMALPFEYKALRLLKDLQQQSRAYVAKTTVKTAALKPEKRLSGELDKILQPVQRIDAKQRERRMEVLQTTLSLLENHKTAKKFGAEDRLLLNETERYMIAIAADQPATFLSALTNVRKLSTNGKTTFKELELIQNAISKMIKHELIKPEISTAKPSSALYKGYFKHLNKTGKSDGI